MSRVGFGFASSSWVGWSGLRDGRVPLCRRNVRSDLRRGWKVRRSFEGAPPNGGGGGGGYSWGGDESEGDDGGWSLKKVISWYFSLQEENPVLVKSITTGLLVVSSDWVAQMVEKWGSRKMEWDVRRAFAMAVYGTLFLGPMLHYWYGALDRMFPVGGLSSLVPQVLCDQLGMAFVAQFGYLFITSICEGMTLVQTRARIRKLFLQGMLLNWRIWPIAQTLNFAVIPRPLQLLWVNLVGFVYTVSLSVLCH